MSEQPRAATLGGTASLSPRPKVGRGVFVCIKRRVSMSAILQELEHLRRDAEESLALAQTGDATRTWHGDYLGRKGRLTTLLRTLGSLPAEERAQAGKAANDVKVALEAALEERQAAIEQAELEARLN